MRVTGPPGTRHFFVSPVTFLCELTLDADGRFLTRVEPFPDAKEGRMKRLHLLPIAIVVAMAWSMPAQAAIIHVPGDQPGIAAALAVAQAGDQVLIAPGVYSELHLEVPAGVHVAGAGASAADVVIDAQATPAMRLLGGDSIVEMLHFSGDPEVTAFHAGGGIAALGGTPTVRDVIIEGFRTSLGGGIFARDCELAVQDCIIQDCEAQLIGGGIYAVSADVIVTGSALYANSAGHLGGAWYGAMGSLSFEQCTIVDNAAPVGGEGGAFNGLGASVINCIMMGNAAADAGAEQVVAGDLAGRALNACSLRWQPGWPGYLADQLADASAGNLEADPLFCHAPGGLEFYLGLSVDSPALGAPGCGLIGAFGHGCGAVGVLDDEQEQVPVAVTRLHGAYPNPFNPQTSIRYELGRAGPVKVAVYALDGRRVATLVDERQSAGAHEIAWSGRDDAGRSVASGVYMCRLVTDELRGSVRMTLVK